MEPQKTQTNKLMNDWKIIINSKGNLEKHGVFLNGVPFYVQRFEIINDVNEVLPSVRMTFFADGIVNNFEFITDTTEYKDQVIVATAKDVKTDGQK